MTYCPTMFDCRLILHACVPGVNITISLVKKSQEWEVKRPDVEHSTQLWVSVVSFHVHIGTFTEIDMLPLQASVNKCQRLSAFERILSDHKEI